MYQVKLRHVPDYLGLYTSNAYPKLHSSLDLPVLHKFNNIYLYVFFICSITYKTQSIIK